MRAQLISSLELIKPYKSLGCGGRKRRLFAREQPNTHFRRLVFNANRFPLLIFRSPPRSNRLFGGFTERDPLLAYFFILPSRSLASFLFAASLFYRARRKRAPTFSRDGRGSRNFKVDDPSFSASLLSGRGERLSSPAA